MFSPGDSEAHLSPHTASQLLLKLLPARIIRVIFGKRVFKVPASPKEATLGEERGGGRDLELSRDSFSTSQMATSATYLPPNQRRTFSHQS